MQFPLSIVLQCADSHKARVKYVFDTLFMAAGIQVKYVREPPLTGPWMLYGNYCMKGWPLDRCCTLLHSPALWAPRAIKPAANLATHIDGLPVLLTDSTEEARGWDVPFDMVVNAFYLLASCSERAENGPGSERILYSDSIFARSAIPQDTVDRYLSRLISIVRKLYAENGSELEIVPQWPSSSGYAVVLSHDVDFLPRHLGDVLTQGGKTLLRHLLRERAPAEALRAMHGLTKALVQGRDPYGCVSDIVRMEQALDVRASFQVAVARRHRLDVNYDIEEQRIRASLKPIQDAAFDLCLHGSYRSTERPAWYVEEVSTLARHFGRPRGSRQHFLAFNYDLLFAAQEQAGIEYDMSMGFPDHVGSRTGFSYPYFPYCLEQERPYDVLQIGLVLMDVTLRGYMGLLAEEAWGVIDRQLEALSLIGGCASVVWHPIVFGGARDPGYGELFWKMVDRIKQTRGLATDGATINDYWRARARQYSSFANFDRSVPAYRADAK